MNVPDELKVILDRIANHQQSEADIAVLRQWFSSDSQIVTQTGKYPVNLGQGQDIHVGDRTYQGADAEAIRQILGETLQSLQPNRQPIGIPENLPRSGVVQFVGRERELATLHQQLQENERVAVCVIAGMGGVGKTELALQYALKYKQTYQGGICWLQAKGINVDIQIVQFGQSRLQLNPPEDLDSLAQVGFCWTHWHPGEVLVMLDDVSDYEVIKSYLPPAEPRFKVLITTRLRLGKSVKQLEIDVLDESAALALLESLVGAERIQRELDNAKKLCAWLGYLPLGLELVGRYLDRKPDLSLADMQQRLESKRLEAQALQKPDSDMTAPLGVAAAFELSWEMLDEPAQQLAYLLSLFALAPIPWSFIEQAELAYNLDALEESRDESLCSWHLLQRVSAGNYQLHQLIREFFRAKLELSGRAEDFRGIFCKTMLAVAEDLLQTTDQEAGRQVTSSIPHIIEAGTMLRTLPITLSEEYTHLANLIAAGSWREANDATRIIILKAVNQEKQGWLANEQIQNFPYQILRAVDQLWVQFSNQRFGFSVQKRIFNECENDPQAFGDRVGWRIQKAWISASQVIYTPANAPDGHLPWGIMQVITMDNAALDAFVHGLRSVTKTAARSDWQKQLLADFMAFGGFFIGDRIDKEEFKRKLEYELSHDEAWWEGQRLEESKVRKLFSLLVACPNL